MSNSPTTNQVVVRETSANMETNEDAPNKAATLPFELVEQILVYLPAPDLIIAAPNVPKFWRSVIENSTEIRAHLRHHDRSLWTRERTPTIVGYRQLRLILQWTFCHRFADGTLYLHRKDGNTEGIVFAPEIKTSQLRVLDSTKTIAKYNKYSKTGSGHGFIELFDFDGELICSTRVAENRKDSMWKYISTFGEEGMAMDDVYKSRRVNQVAERWGGDSALIARA